MTKREELLKRLHRKIVIQKEIQGVGRPDQKKEDHLVSQSYLEIEEGYLDLFADKLEQNYIGGMQL